MIEKETEKDSPYRHLETLSPEEILLGINREDKSVPLAVEKSLPQIINLADAVYNALKNGGRLFYIGSGTSGRLGIVDASECPPTFGVSPDLVIGLIAGGDKAIRKAQEGAEDNLEAAWKDLQDYLVSTSDIVIGISASGTTPYVLGGLKMCNENNITTGSIVCNSKSPIADASIYPVEVIVGPEFITGSTRMKAGTAQKLVLNMISTSVMIRMGRVKDNKMVDMQLTNQKLVDRGTRMLMNLYHWEYNHAQKMLLEYGSVRNVLDELGTK